MEKDILISLPISRRETHTVGQSNALICSSDCGALWLSKHGLQEICAKKKCCKRFKKSGKKKCKNCPKRK